MGTEDSKRYDKLRQDFQIIKDAINGHGTGNLSGDVDEYQDPISLATEHYFGIMKSWNSKSEKLFKINNCWFTVIRSVFTSPKKYQLIKVEIAL